MADSRLRELERRWRATGSLEDQGAYLLERVRAGELTRAALELAAGCGHPGAQAALGVPAPQRPTLQQIDGLSRAAAVAGCVGLARDANVARLWLGSAGEPQARAALEAADAWLACPCDPHAQAAARAGFAALTDDTRRQPELPAFAANIAGYTALAIPDPVPRRLALRDLALSGPRLARLNEVSPDFVLRRAAEARYLDHAPYPGTRFMQIGRAAMDLQQVAQKAALAHLGFAE